MVLLIFSPKPGANGKGGADYSGVMYGLPLIQE
jgi:hypothetical protein